ncbi:5'-nucleotidase C-terminal domain-containing protein [Nocardia amamiensis]|uniref:5'-nucleotidase C-terminal domain-containing protein n=1 Tax=Nocardia amamiensis TaxID=404578 RepID=A0ABS0CUD2_9NOCA|nr:5'-nucleotidase C-terminal domain-containing protein [Nocardia amamiensis]MBF6300219.1 5'-nucleotidase C-terminal domain-containing protein [Nocardia amamiensis]
MRARRRIAVILAGLVGVGVIGGCGAASDPSPGLASSAPPIVPLISTNDLRPAQPDEVHLFGFNDLHGHLQPPSGSTGKIAGYDAGGAAYLATHLARLKAAYPASVVLAAGDNIGASPLVSGLFHDEPTIAFLNNAGVAASAVGNHEFDEGVLELARLQQGGCAVDGCSPGAPFTGARFPYLAANVADAQGELPPALRPWTLLEVGGHKIGVIGTVTPETANIVLPEGIRGYLFGDQAAAVNRYVPEMKAAGAEAIVALVHDGGSQRPERDAPLDYNGCANITPNVTGLAERVDPAVRAVITGHSHQPYVCVVGGKVVTQAASYGRLISDITLRFGADGVQASAVNRVVSREVTPDDRTNALIDFYAEQARPRAGRVVGATADALPHSPRPAGASPLGDVIADSMLSVTAGPAAAVAAFMNPGGVRADLKQGPITYGDIFTVQPFGNQVVTLTLTGSQILRLLEQQWSNPGKPTVLSTAGLTYAYSDSAAAGAKVIADSVRVAGRPLNPVATYRVTANSFLASGGDGFTVFTEGTDTAAGPTDLDAFETFLRDKPPLQAPPARVEKK